MKQSERIKGYIENAQGLGEYERFLHWINLKKHKDPTKEHGSSLFSRFTNLGGKHEQQPTSWI